jgi:hypothetical protein
MFSSHSEGAWLPVFREISSENGVWPHGMKTKPLGIICEYVFTEKVPK